MAESYWELWSCAGNLSGTFATREQLIEEVADYIQMYGHTVVKWVLGDVAIEYVVHPGRGHPHHQGLMDGTELLTEALTYG